MSSSGTRPDGPTFFVDRSLGGRIVPVELRNAGASVVAPDEQFKHDTPDTDWLAECGRRGWVVLTRDKRLRYRPSELEALIESGYLVFVVTASAMTGADDAALLVRALPAMTALAATVRRPAIYRVNSSGKPELVRAGKAAPLRRS